MRFSTPVILAALAFLATVQALPADANGEKVLEKQDDTAEGTQDDTGKTQNKVSGFDHLTGRLEHFAGDKSVDEEIDGDGEDGTIENITGDHLDGVEDDFFIDCLHDHDLKDCPDLDGFDGDDCLLLSRVDCLKKVRKFLSEHDD